MLAFRDCAQSALNRIGHSFLQFFGRLVTPGVTKSDENGSYETSGNENVP
jgi:hypothetical protein